MRRVALKGLAARPLRTALTTLAIVIGVAFVAAAYTLTDTMQGAADSLSTAAYDGTDAVVTAPKPFDVGDDSVSQAPTIPAATLAKVRSAPGVGVAVGDVTDTAQIVGGNGKPVGTGPYFGVGFDARTPGTARLTPLRLKAGRWATGPGQVVIDQATAEKEHYAVGDSIRISTRGPAKPFRVTGIATFASVKSLGTATAAVFDLGTAQRLFDKAGAYDRILVAGKPGSSAAGVRKAVAAATGRGAQVQSASADDRFTLDGLKQFISIIRVVLLAFAVVAIVVGAFTIFNALSITVAQRTREFGLLRMVGATRRQVRRSVLLEALAIGLLASALGIAVGVALAMGLDALFVAVGLDLPEQGTVLAAHTFVVPVLLGTVVTVAAGLIPAVRATRVAPVAALRDADAGARKVGPFARLVRAVASLVGRPAERLGGSAGRLARRNAMRQPGRTAVTASALMIGVALVTAVTVVAAGLKDQSTGSIERHVSATQVIAAADGWSPIDPEVERTAAAAPDVTTATSIRQDSAQAFGDMESVNAVDPAKIGKVYSFEWKAGDQATLATLGTDGAVVTDDWAKKHGLGVGDRFTVRTLKGERLSLVVRGIEHRSMIDVLGLGPITISRQAFDGAFTMERNRFTLVAATDDAALGRAMAAFPDVELQTKGEFIHKQTEWIDMILAILWVLLALAVIVSLFGIVNTLVLSTFERTRELGMLRAVGMTRRQVRRMVRHESVITALIGGVLGIAAGLGLAGAVTAWLSKYGLTYSVPVASLVAVAVVAALAGVAAAVLPARRAARIDVLTALQYE